MQIVNIKPRLTQRAIFPSHLLNSSSHSLQNLLPSSASISGIQQQSSIICTNLPVIKLLFLHFCIPRLTISDHSTDGPGNKLFCTRAFHSLALKPQPKNKCPTFSIQPGKKHKKHPHHNPSSVTLLFLDSGYPSSCTISRAYLGLSQG
jgi:hypothetical protein